MINIIPKKCLRVDTTCLCCLMSVFLVFPALSMSSDVSRPTVELSWLNNLVWPENSWLDQSRWYLGRLVPGPPLQVPCPPFTPPLKPVLRQPPRVEYLCTCAAAALCTHTSRCLLNVSCSTKHDSWVNVKRNSSDIWEIAIDFTVSAVKYGNQTLVSWLLQSFKSMVTIWFTYTNFYLTLGDMWDSFISSNETDQRS